MEKKELGDELEKVTGGSIVTHTPGEEYVTDKDRSPSKDGTSEIVEG